MSKKILINANWKEKRVAVIENGKLVELRVERNLENDATFGDIYKGKVANVLPGMDAAFVNIGMDKNAFIHACDAAPKQNEKQEKIQKLVQPGQEVLVQIKKEAFGSKGARVTASLTIPGRYLVLMPKTPGLGISRRIEDEDERERLKAIAEEIRPANMGLIVRTAAKGVEKENLALDLAFLLDTWGDIERKASTSKAPLLLYSDSDLSYRLVRDLIVEDLEEIVVDSAIETMKLRKAIKRYNSSDEDLIRFYTDKEPLFSAYGIETEIEKSLRRKIWLDCGGFLIFDQTEALLSVDVNTGKFTGHNSLQQTVLRTNLDAAEEIARQLRLRNIGGIIIIDFIDMENQDDREKVRQRLEEHLKQDRTKTHVLGFTSLGLLELTRQKSSHDLGSTLQKTCPLCNGSGKVWQEETVAFKVVRDLITTRKESPAVSYVIKLHPVIAEKLKELSGDHYSELSEYINAELRFEYHSEFKHWEYAIEPNN
jgi:ribonuclease G